MEFQNDFFGKNGKLGMYQEDDDFVTNARKILDSAREKGQLVIHVNLAFSSEFEELREDVDGILSLVRQKKAFQEKSDGVQAIHSMLPMANEPCIFKHSISAFERTSLEETLKTRGIENVIFLGLISNVCMESSIRSAYDKGFRVFAIRDASHGLNDKVHEHAMSQTIPLFATVKDTAEFLNQQ